MDSSRLLVQAPWSNLKLSQKGLESPPQEAYKDPPPLDLWRGGDSGLFSFLESLELFGKKLFIAYGEGSTKTATLVPTRENFGQVYPIRPNGDRKGFGSLTFKAIAKLGRVFWLPQLPTTGRKASDLGETPPPFFAVEIDSGSFEEQLAAIKALPIQPYLLAHSGGKSIHAYFWIGPSDWLTWKSLQRIILMMIGGDSQVASSNRPMMLPGIDRKSPGDTPIHVMGAKYSPSEATEMLLSAWPLDLDPGEAWPLYSSLVTRSQKGQIEGRSPYDLLFNHLDEALDLLVKKHSPKPKPKSKPKSLEGIQSLIKSEACLEREGFQIEIDKEAVKGWLEAAAPTIIERVPGEGTYPSFRALAVAIANVFDDDFASDWLTKNCGLSGWDWDQLLASSSGRFNAVSLLRSLETLSEWKPSKQDKAIARASIKAEKKSSFFERLIAQVTAETKKLQRDNLQGAKPDFTYSEDFNQAAMPAFAKGAKLIVDVSAAGAGKTFAASRDLDPADFRAEQLWWADNHHMNSKNNHFDEFGHAVSRHGYLAQSDMGRIFRVPPDANPEDYNIVGEPNCKMLDVVSLAQRLQRFDENVCNACPFRDECKSTPGQYLHDRAQAKLSEKVLLHPRTLNPNDLDPEYNKKGQDYRAVLVYDEMDSFPLENKIEIPKWALDQQLGEFVQALDLASPAIAITREILIAIKDKGKYGLSPSELRAAIKTRTSGFTVLPDVSILAELENLRMLAKQEGKKLKAVEVENFTSYLKGRVGYTRQWFYALQDWLLGKEGYSARVSSEGVLIVTAPNHALATNVSLAETTFLLSADVKSKSLLAARLGLREEQIVFIARDGFQALIPENVDFRGIDVGFKIQSQNSEAQKERLRKLHTKLKEITGDYCAIASKGIGLDGALQRFTESKGVNTVAGTQHIAIFGLPFSNLNDAKMQFDAQGGDLTDEEAFKAFYDKQCLDWLIQEVGRLRAHQHPNQRFTVILVGQPSDFPPELGENPWVSAFALDPELGSDKEKKAFSILEAAEALAKDGISAIQETLASIFNIAQSTVSRLLQRAKLLRDQAQNANIHFSYIATKEKRIKPSQNTSPLANFAAEFWEMLKVALGDAIKQPETLESPPTG